MTVIRITIAAATTVIITGDEKRRECEMNGTGLSVSETASKTKGGGLSRKEEFKLRALLPFVKSGVHRASPRAVADAHPENARTAAGT